MEEGVKGLITGLVAVVGALFSIFIGYGLIYVWIRECIDYTINNKKLMDLTGDDDESSLPPCNRRFRNLFLLPCALAFPLASWLCIDRLMGFSNKLFALSCIASLTYINYYCVSSIYVPSAKWLVSRCYRYNSCYSREAVKLIVGILIMSGGLVVHKSVEGQAIIAATAITIMSVIAYTWKEDRSGFTAGFEYGYSGLVFVLIYAGKDLWYHGTEARTILAFTLILSFIAILTTEKADDHHQDKVANLKSDDACKMLPV